MDYFEKQIPTSHLWGKKVPLVNVSYCGTLLVFLHKRPSGEQWTIMKKDLIPSPQTNLLDFLFLSDWRLIWTLFLSGWLIKIKWGRLIDLDISYWKRHNSFSVTDWLNSNRVDSFGHLLLKGHNTEAWEQRNLSTSCWVGLGESDGWEEHWPTLTRDKQGRDIRISN
jgi:hypothetical protein